MSDSHRPSGAEELLSTKLAAPHLRTSLVTRQHLFARLDEGLERQFTLISAPAGFGKTTLVADWISGLENRKADSQRQRGKKPLHNRQSEISDRTIAWVSLDPDDNDPVRFWRYVFTACQVFQDDIGVSVLGVLNYSPQPPFEVLLTGFINQAAQLEQSAVLVLDDYHVITTRQIQETLAFFLENLPPQLHVILMTRSDPPLPLGRMRARNELSEMRMEDLRFSFDETQAFIEQSISSPLPPEIVTRLGQRTEGWAAGLHLMSIALMRRKDQGEIQRFLETFTGSMQPIQEYLVEEVFNAQSEVLQEFLLRVSFLNRLTGSLCDEVTGRDDGSILLSELERANLFLAPIDSKGLWYRFHALFAEAMQHYARMRLGEAQLREIHHKASRWYEGQGMLPEAVEAALSSLDTDRAAALIQRIIEPHMARVEPLRNEKHTLRRWMEQIPEEVLRAHPIICMPFAETILFTSDRHAQATKLRLQTPLQIAEAHWRSEGNTPKLGEVLAFRSLVARLQREFDESFSLARQALQLLPASERHWRGISLIRVGEEELYAGRMHNARQVLTEARAILETAENIYGILDTTLLLGLVCCQQGELRQATHLFQQALARLESAPIDRDRALIRKGQALLGLGALALEQNDLEAAEQYVAEGIRISQQFPDEDLLAHGSLLRARILFARGEIEKADEALGALIAQSRYPVLHREARTYQARLFLAVGDLPSAQRWSANRTPTDDDFMGFYQEQEALVDARLLLAQDEAEEALGLLKGWRVDARANGRVISEMLISVLMAQALAALDNLHQACEALRQALALGQPEGFRRLFLDEGEPLSALMWECRGEINHPKQQRLLEYVDRLLIAFPEWIPGPGERGKVSPPDVRMGMPNEAISTLLEPLTEQEQRVLGLLGAGLTNQEIAEELVISLNTVKSHVKSIYRKLDVSSRREARRAARLLKLV